jgi:deoxycytidylate deaminase
MDKSQSLATEQSSQRLPACNKLLPAPFLTAIGAIQTSGVTRDPNLTAYVGAVLVRGGRVLSVATNISGFVNKWAKRYNDLYAHHEFIESTHAEVAVILRARKKIELTGSKLYVARMTIAGEVSFVSPCPMCVEVIKLHGISRVFCTIDSQTYSSFVLQKI